MAEGILDLPQKRNSQENRFLTAKPKKWDRRRMADGLGGGDGVGGWGGRGIEFLLEAALFRDHIFISA